MALLTRFFVSTILFSQRTDFEKNLKKELWLCHRNMNLSMDELYKMTVADRKSFIQIHNKEVEKEKAKYNIKGNFKKGKRK